MVGVRARQVSAVVGRYGVVYPALATGGVVLASRILAVPFDTVLFYVFAVAVVVTGFGAMGGSSSTDALQYGAGVGGTSNPGERWESPLLIKLALFDLGLAAVLSVHAYWWASWG